MERNLLIVFTILWILSLAGNFVLNEKARHSLNSAFEERRAFTKRIEDFQSFYNNLKNAEAGQRGYIITGNIDFLDSYNHALDRFHHHKQILQHEKKYDYAYIIEKIEELSLLKFFEMNLVLDLYAKQGSIEAQNKVKNAQEKNLMVELDKEISSIIEILDKNRTHQDEEIKRNFQRIYALNLYGKLLYIAFTIAFIGFLYHKMKKHKEVYEKLKTAQNDLKFTLEEARLGTWDWDVKTGKIEWSPFTKFLFGINDNKQLTIDSFFNRLLPEEREKISEKLYQVISEKENFSETYRIVLPSGTVRTITSRGRISVDSNNRPEKMIGICWDVTSLSHSYNLLQVSYGVSRVLNDADSITDALQKIIPILDRAFGWKLLVLWLYNEKESHLTCAEIIHEPEIELPYFKKSIENLAVNRADSIPTQVFASSRPVWFEDLGQEMRLIRSEAAKKENVKGALAIPVVDESRINGVLELFKFSPLVKDEIDQGILNLMTTIGIELGQFIKKREAYNNLRKMEEKYRQVIEISEEWIYEIDSNFIFTFSNHRVQKILGYGVHDVLGKDFISFVPLEEQAEVKKKCEYFLADKTGWKKWSFPWQAKNGIIHQLESNASPILDEQGELRGFRGTNRDITEFLKIEKTKDEFISVVSHELRTPLTSIHGALGLINATLTNLPEDVNELLEIAYRNSERLTRIINDILDVEKIRLGKLEIKLEPCFLDEIIRDSMKGSMPLAQNNQIELVEETEFPRVIVFVDKERLIQVMMNLLNNAISFSFSHSTVSVSILEYKEFVRVSVHDDGIGISEDFKPSIFNKFAQADSSDSRSGKGTGLGLSISKSLIESFGGKIGFNSVLGKGSTFYFDLPLHPN